MIFSTVLADDADDDNAELSDEEAADGDANEAKQRQRRQQVCCQCLQWNAKYTWILSLHSLLDASTVYELKHSLLDAGKIYELWSETETETADT